MEYIGFGGRIKGYTANLVQSLFGFKVWDFGGFRVVRVHNNHISQKTCTAILLPKCEVNLHEGSESSQAVVDPLEGKFSTYMQREFVLARLVAPQSCSEVGLLSYCLEGA